MDGNSQDFMEGKPCNSAGLKVKVCWTGNGRLVSTEGVGVKVPL